MVKLNIPRSVMLSLIAAVAMSVAACGGGKDNDLGDRIGTSDPSVRFANAVPNAKLSLYRNGSNDGLNANGLAYGEITKFSGFKDDSSTFSIRDQNNVEIGVAGSFNAANGHRYLAVAFPNLTSSTIASAMSLQVLDDPYNRKASVVPTVRVVNAVASLGNLDVYVGKVNDPIGSPSVSNLGYQSFWPMSGNDAQKLDDVDGKFRVRITPAGDPNNVLFDSQEIDLSTNADAVLFILPTQPTTNALTAPLKRGDLRVRVNDGNDGSDATFDVIDHL